MKKLSLKLKCACLPVVTGVLALSFLLSCGGGDGAGKSKTLVMFCAAGIKAPVSEVAKQYEKEYGVKVQLQYGGSGTLLSSLEIAPGDIYLAADSSYTDLAKKKNLLAETMPVAFMRAGFGVPKGNPKGLSKLADLKRDDLKIGLANPDAASVGKFTKKVLSKHGIWKDVKPTVLLPTVNELANALKLGTVDVVICWDALTHQYDEIDFVNLPEFDLEKKNITVGVLNASKQPTEALRFCRYLTAKDKGLPVFAADGYEVVQGDEWALKPNILLFSGAMLRPAIQDTVKAFEKREGVVITPVYNGCGVLVSQMKAGEKPDAYFSCDVKFMEMVQDRFLESTLVSANEMVILTEKGNPKGVKKLTDLSKPGLRLGFAHPEKSALGFLTKYLLEHEKLYQQVVDSGNIKMDSPTGDFLVNQVKTGSLDAVIVYKSNAMASQSTVDDYEIVGIDRPEAIAQQPYAVAKNSKHRYLLERFFTAAVSAPGKEKFMKHGFLWELGKEQEGKKTE
ncbi:MAG: molybdate ABC transporter substrate-binding protein [Verrucomicrobiales bacterium]|nr:molybdate ABC transporter substrate-binding protein [Verrucomicrobiales bacterium]